MLQFLKKIIILWSPLAKDWVNQIRRNYDITKQIVSVRRLEKHA